MPAYNYLDKPDDGCNKIYFFSMSLFQHEVATSDLYVKKIILSAYSRRVSMAGNLLIFIKRELASSDVWGKSPYFK